MKLNSIDGEYYPSFFTMVLKTNDDVEVAIEQNTQTFVHEFIHYLQDFILPYNIRLNLTNLSLFQNIRISAVEKRKLTRPFNDWNENSRILRTQRHITLGGNKFIKNAPCIESVKSNVQFIVPSTGARVFEYTLVLKQPRKNYHIGAVDMLEYIAHKVESKHYQVDTYQMPYQTIDYVFDHYQLSDIPFDVRLCIVEYCLYNDNPVHLLFSKFLDNNFIVTNKKIFTNYKKCYMFLLNDYFWHAKGGFYENAQSKVLRRLKNFKDELTNQFNAHQFDAIIFWIDKVTTFVEENFINKFLFSDIYQMSLQELMDYINNILDAVGFPLIMNKENKCKSILSPDIEQQQFIQFYILEKFMQYIETKDKACPIYDFCNANGSISNKSCKVFPDLSINAIGNCPYSMFLASYNLTNIT